MIDKYTKITYQSNPIGKEQIVLYLTTFDLKAFDPFYRQCHLLKH